MANSRQMSTKRCHIFLFRHHESAVTRQNPQEIENKRSILEYASGAFLLGRRVFYFTPSDALLERENLDEIAHKTTISRWFMRPLPLTQPTEIGAEHPKWVNPNGLTVVSGVPNPAPLFPAHVLICSELLTPLIQQEQITKYKRSPASVNGFVDTYESISAHDR